MAHPLNVLMEVDGAMFVAIGLLVLVIPDPRPALLHPLDPAALRPFEDTRRLLAAMFLGSGLLVLVVGLGVTEPGTLFRVSLARLLSFAVVAAVNVSQLRGRDWKRPPLLLLLGAWLVLGALYGWLGMRAA
jgi:hypothetical protein